MDQNGYNKVIFKMYRLQHIFIVEWRGWLHKVQGYWWFRESNFEFANLQCIMWYL